MENEKQEESEREIITREQREQFIKDQDLIAGRDMKGCRVMFFVLLGAALIMLALFCTKHPQSW